MLVTPPSSSSSSSASSSMPSRSPPRGAFIVLEGVDRCGKTTQVGLLVKHLIKALGMAAVAMRFPDRTTVIGQMIDKYLRDKTHHVDDHAIHLLFSANRWEVVPTLTNHLYQGTTVVCDRYAYSGVAFSSAKQQIVDKISGETSPVMSMEWCQGPDVGLPAPDAVIFLDLSQDEAEQRGGYGGERYETRELQGRVRQRFAELQAKDEQEGQVPWHIVNAARSIEDVEQDIQQIVAQTIQVVQQKQQIPTGGEGQNNDDTSKKSKPLQLLWQKINASTAIGDTNKENLP